MSSVVKLTQQVGRLTLSGLLQNVASKISPNSVISANLLSVSPKACAVSRIAASSHFNAGQSSNRAFSSSSLTAPTEPKRVDLDVTKIFPNGEIPEHVIPANVLSILLKNPSKGLRPAVVQKRLAKLRTYKGRQKSIRGSPWKLNLVCHLAAGLPVVEALNQLKFCVKAKAPLVSQVIQRTANLASIRDGLPMSQLEVATCFSTHGIPLKRIRYHAKGRHGEVRREFSHLNVTLREIDFDLKMVQSKTLGEMKRWLMHKAMVSEEQKKMNVEAKEMEILERRAQEIAEKRRKSSGETKQ